MQSGQWQITTRLVTLSGYHKLLYEIAHSVSNSTDVDALKFWLVQQDKFYGGEKQQDASECLMMLLELINKGSVPYCGSNDNYGHRFLYLKSYFR